MNKSRSFVASLLRMTAMVLAIGAAQAQTPKDTTKGRSGLAGSEQIITEGKQNVRPGAKVRLASELNKGSDNGKAVHVAAKG